MAGKLMVARSAGMVLKHLKTLFDHGAIGGLSDGQLLERFALHRDEGAEAAFAALVERHGPMVLRLCRQVIGDEHEAQDAAQTVFLVLARRSGSIRRRDSIASWLYTVTRRIATRARVTAARRREIEWRGDLIAGHCEDDCGQTVPQTELYEELDRLPERYRVPLVLCHLEGLTHEQAAQRLRCPVRTVETRLLRGRARLRERLIRRGLVPSAVLAGATSAASAALPAPWMEATVRAGIAITGGHGMGIGMVAVPAVALAEGVLNAMFLKRSFSVMINSSKLLNSHSLTQSSSGETPRGSRSRSNRPKCRRSSFSGSTSTRLRPKGCMSATIATGAVDR
jgi:RNA polymerase sigma factor (sigma-70 family)